MQKLVVVGVPNITQKLADLIVEGTAAALAAFETNRASKGFACDCTCFKSRAAWLS